MTLNKSCRIPLLDLPTELVLLIVSFLDNASRASFGYASKQCLQYKIADTQLFTVKDKRLIVLDAITNDYTNLLELHLPSSDQDKKYIIEKNKVQFYNIAVSSGSLQVLILMQKYYDVSIRTNDDILQQAIRYDRIEIIKWFRESNSTPYEFACTCAAECGHFEILKYLHENGYPWDTWTWSFAAGTRNLEIMQYLYENGCQIEWRMSNGCQS
jgi:hypothetical protein